MITLRESISADENNWSACLHNGKEFMMSKEHSIHVIDRIGAGDAFSAGMIYGFIKGMTDSETFEFATAASCLKHSIPGDFCLLSVDEVQRLVSGSASGRIQR